MSRPFWIGAAVGLGGQSLLFTLQPILALVLHAPALWAVGFSVQEPEPPPLLPGALALSVLAYSALSGVLAHVVVRRRARRR